MNPVEPVPGQQLRQARGGVGGRRWDERRLVESLDLVWMLPDPFVQQIDIGWVVDIEPRQLDGQTARHHEPLGVLTNHRAAGRRQVTDAGDERCLDPRVNTEAASVCRCQEGLYAIERPRPSATPSTTGSGRCRCGVRGLDEQGGEAGVRRLLDETVDRVGRDQRGLSHPEPGVAITGGPEARAQQTDSEPGYEEHNTRRLRAHDSSVRTGREGHCTITS